MFTKEERSTFKYWFAHWCAFQLVALILRAWRPKYLFHDIEKPWLRLWYRKDYSKVRTWHRTHRKHHLNYPGNKDYIEMMIDWECSRFTKEDAPLSAYQCFKRRESSLSEIDYIGVKKALSYLGLSDGQNEIKLENVKSHGTFI